MLLVRHILCKHDLMFYHWIGITANNTAFKPSHNLIDNRNVIVNGKEREVWHFGIHTCVDVLFAYWRTKCNVSCFSFEDGCWFLASDWLAVQWFWKNLIAFYGDIVTIFVFGNSKEYTKLRGFVCRSWIEQEWHSIHFLLKNEILPIFFQFMYRFYNGGNHAWKGLEKVRFPTSVWAVYNAYRQ